MIGYTDWLRRTTVKLTGFAPEDVSIERTTYGKKGWFFSTRHAGHKTAPWCFLLGRESVKEHFGDEEWLAEILAMSGWPLPPEYRGNG